VNANSVSALIFFTVPKRVIQWGIERFATTIIASFPAVRQRTPANVLHVIVSDRIDGMLSVSQKLSIPKTVSNVFIVGTGLIGSSIGLAVKKRHLAETVIGVDNCKKTLDIALRRGAIDTAFTGLNSLSKIDNGLAIICTPVRTIVEYANQIAAINSNILISDVGSAKGNICYTLEQQGHRFVGAHPIAGSEKSGPEFGDSDLFQSRLTVLTPTASSCPQDVEQLRCFC
jgi:prephenate dehydrogenase